MNDKDNLNPPAVLETLLKETASLGFQMGSEQQTGAILRTLAASRIGGKILEIGTGTGIGTAWLLDGMDQTACLTSIELDPQVQAVARQYLSHDSRVTFLQGNAEAYLTQTAPGTFDLIFADTFPGKFYLFEAAWALLKIGGLYVIDDLLPQSSWPADHAAKVPILIAQLESRHDLRLTKLAWASGLIIAVKTA